MEFVWFSVAARNTKFKLIFFASSCTSAVMLSQFNWVFRLVETPLSFSLRVCVQLAINDESGNKSDCDPSDSDKL